MVSSKIQGSDGKTLNDLKGCLPSDNFTRLIRLDSEYFVSVIPSLDMVEQEEMGRAFSIGDQVDFVMEGLGLDFQ